MPYARQVRRIAVIMVVVGLLPACGRGYEAANRAIVAELPELDHVQLLEEEHYGFCSGDSCAFGNDRSGALLVYSVDTSRYTQGSLVDAYRSSLDGWEATIEETCADADPSVCDETVLASFTSGDARIDLNLDNWPAERFELHVDAKGAP